MSNLKTPKKMLISGRGHTSAQNVEPLLVSSPRSYPTGKAMPKPFITSSFRKMHFREQGLTEEEAKVKLYYFCETCGKSYANKAGLRLHKLHVHDKYSEEVPCHVCGISFRTRELLKQHHEREHSIEPKFVCEECGQRFGNSYHLKRHMTSHSTDGFPCSLCSRVFKRKDGLDTHFSTAHR